MTETKGKLPKELFETVAFGKERKYHFINLKGEKDYVELRDSDMLTTKTCPIDGAYIVAYGGDPHTVPECPVCNEYFEGREDQVRKRIEEKYIPKIKSDINKLKENLNYLEKILELAENPDNNIRKANLQHKAYNKANLSAKNSSEPSIDSFPEDTNSKEIYRKNTNSLK